MILCLGTTPVYQRTMIFDRLTNDAVNRAREVYDYASGKSVNAARVIHTLGEPVLATGFVGGVRGVALCGDLAAAGVSHDFVSGQVETRQCTTLIDRAAGTATELVEESAGVGRDAWAELELKLRRLLPKASVWIFSGTLAPDGPKDFYARWVPLAREVGARVIIDVSGDPLRLAMAQAGAILKMNRDEFSVTLGRDLSDESALVAAMLQHTPHGGALLVTLGAAGAMASDGQSCWKASSPKVATVSAVGSGDSFAAGLGIGLYQNQSLAEALQLAIACGAANAMTAKAGHIVPQAMLNLRTAVVVEPLR